MKKYFILIFIIFIFFGCAKSQKDNDEIFEIRERMFLGQVNDIYLNSQDYLGRKIKLEGIFMDGVDEITNEPFYFVIRYGPGGCCGIDGLVGFEVAWAEDNNQVYPESEEWVEAMGELKTYVMDGYELLYLDLHSLTVLDVRGKEFISQ